MAKRRLQDIAELSLVVLQIPALYHVEAALGPSQSTVPLLPSFERGRRPGPATRWLGKLLNLNLTSLSEVEIYIT